MTRPRAEGEEGEEGETRAKREENQEREKRTETEKQQEKNCRVFGGGIDVILQKLSFYTNKRADPRRHGCIRQLNRGVVLLNCHQTPVCYFGRSSEVSGDGTIVKKNLIIGFI